MKSIKLILLSLITLLLLSCGNNQNQSTNYLSKSINNDSLLLQNWGPNYKYRIDSTELESAFSLIYETKGINFNEPSAFNVIIGDFKIISKIIYKYKTNSNVDLSKKSLLLEKKLKSHQKKVFPILRKKYILYAKELLWQNDVNVNGTNTTINFIGYYFASNRNIQDTYDILYSMLKQLRFKRANFKFSEYGEYTFYKINSVSDENIINY